MGDWITVNIGPGPNSNASLRIERHREEKLSQKETETLRSLLAAEDGETLQKIAFWLSATREIEIHLAGAHHDIEEVDEGRFCLFCGENYEWAVRYSRNRGGAA